MLDRSTLARTIASRLHDELPRLAGDFGPTMRGRVRSCWIDELLPPSWHAAASDAVPDTGRMVRRANGKERKYVSADLGILPAPLPDLVAAFNSEEVATEVACIMGKARLEVDRRLYNGGVTVMAPGDYMCPHLDNSHDGERRRRREIVLLYYLTDHWTAADGGQLELWDDDMDAPPRPVEFRGNRLVMMETTDHSWHSVRPITGRLPRANVTTYFYAPATEVSRRRLTHFAPWPGQRALLQGAMFELEFRARSLAARFGGHHLHKNRHVSRQALPEAGAASANPGG